MRDFGIALIRLILGIIFAMHGYAGLVVFTPAATARSLAGAGLPAPEILTWYVIAAHLVGGAMLILGLWTRLAALANVPVMLGAVLFIHVNQGFFMKGILVDRAAGTVMAGGYEYALLVLVVTSALVLTGGGALATTRDR